MANNGSKEFEYVVGIDIGTSKVACIVGKYIDQHSIEIVSMGSYPSSGLKKGVVVNIDATTDAIKKSIDQAQASFDEKIKNAEEKLSQKDLTDHDSYILNHTINTIKEIRD